MSILRGRHTSNTSVPQQKAGRYEYSGSSGSDFHLQIVKPNRKTQNYMHTCKMYEKVIFTGSLGLFLNVISKTMDLLYSGSHHNRQHQLILMQQQLVYVDYLCHTCRLSGWVYCHQTHGLREVEQHNCLVLPVPLMGSHHTVDVSVGPIHKILKNGNCVGMLQYLFIESSKGKKVSYTYYSKRNCLCSFHF